MTRSTGLVGISPDRLPSYSFRSSALLTAINLELQEDGKLSVGNPSAMRSTFIAVTGWHRFDGEETRAQIDLVRLLRERREVEIPGSHFQFSRDLELLRL